MNGFMKFNKILPMFHFFQYLCQFCHFHEWRRSLGSVTPPFYDIWDELLKKKEKNIYCDPLDSLEWDDIQRGRRNEWSLLDDVERRRLKRHTDRAGVSLITCRPQASKKTKTSSKGWGN